jgi:hypothetical protein
MLATTVALTAFTVPTHAENGLFDINIGGAYHEAESEPFAASIVSGVGQISAIPFYRMGRNHDDVEWEIQNVRVALTREGDKYFATLTYATNANYGAGSEDEKFAVELRADRDTLATLGPNDWAAWCVPRDQRFRKYGPSRGEISKDVFLRADNIFVGKLMSKSHAC